MMYIAQTPMRLAGVDGVLRTVLPGEPIDDFHTWSSFVQRSHLEAGRVALVGGPTRVSPVIAGGQIAMGRDVLAEAPMPEAQLEDVPVEAPMPAAKLAPEATKKARRAT